LLQQEPVTAKASHTFKSALDNHQYGNAGPSNLATKRKRGKQPVTTSAMPSNRNAPRVSDPLEVADSFQSDAKNPDAAESSDDMQDVDPKRIPAFAQVYFWNN
jgi:hypothetical protein